MPESMILGGCTPQPLSAYLKALGILRLLVEQGRDRQAKGYWENDAFVLVTSLSREALETFFLEEYQPTPLVAPWNGSTGFYPKDKAQKRLLQEIVDAPAERFRIYGETIAIAQRQVDALGLTVQPKEKSDKRKLLERLRNELPDEAVKWLDTCALVTSEDLSFPPLAGTGGNDGNFEFSRTFMQQLREVMDFGTGKPNPSAQALLRAALFDDVLPSLPFSGRIGQFNPVAAASDRVNPWDFVLMLEGILLFAAGVTRRYERAEQGSLAYPFTVRPSNAGYGSAAAGEEARAELWAPLWSKPAGLLELQALFREGRAKLGDRAARYGIDFYRAISTLGRDRNIEEFVRYGFQLRNGLSYFAVPLDRFRPQSEPQQDYLSDIDPWLDQFRRAAQDKDAPASVLRANQRLEEAIIDWSRQKATLLDVLIALGEAEADLGRSLKFTTSRFVSPVPLLPRRWLTACWENSSEFRLGLALASNRLRQRLGRARPQERSRFWVWTPNDDGVTTWQAGDLESNLIRLVKREEVEAQAKQKAEKGQKADSDGLKTPKSGQNPEEPEFQPAGQEDAPPGDPKTSQPGSYPAPLVDVVRWIQGEVNAERLEAIARGLSLVDLALTRPSSLGWPQWVPPAYALVAIAHQRRLLLEKIPESPDLQDQGSQPSIKTVSLPRVPNLLNRLAMGDCYGATTLAIRRLRASGCPPAMGQGINESGDRTRRIAAALAFPLSDSDVSRLIWQVRPLPKEDPEDSGKTAHFSSEVSS
ncbi:type I-U CRISPR-associated protein Csx17 [Geitlerinema sp. PCC 7407]|uniref:type I-G CRISPR-associated protein Cas8g1/Csx17 n=1 Tax=Geitlerinema sp. PCC 7407 TaxID=1173025 RepID=UPI00029FAAEE|nr:type I-U CRISPR-associated protein Csx17 [Geitlerinema sp. PCC 7407]AFY66363.1 hypothetical protein GEI7407_1881 [Geitlerinema sp. PCC 7407]